MLNQPDTPSPRTTTLVRGMAVLVGGVAIFSGAAGLWELGQAGFPDGHLTQYDLVVRRPFTALGWLGIVAGGYFFYLAGTAARPRRGTLLTIAIVVYLLFVPGARWGLEYGLKHFTRIDYGQGG